MPMLQGAPEVHQDNHAGQLTAAGSRTALPAPRSGALRRRSRRRVRPMLLALLLVSGLLASQAGVLAETPTPDSGAGTGATTYSVYATGLVNPKGMAFTSDGTLWIAESGEPGEVMVPLPVNFGGEGPIGTNGRISRVPAGGGEREDVVTDLPNIGLYGGVEMLGAASMAVLNDEVYEVSAGHMTVSPPLSRVNTADGTLETFADIGKFNDDNPTPASNGDAVPMGNPYDIAILAGGFAISDGNYNRVIYVSATGEMSLLAQWENSPVTVGIGTGPDGNLYVSQFSPAPYAAGTGRIDMVTPEGEVTEGVVSGLTTPIDVAFGPDGTMYILQYAAEFSAEMLRYIPFGGEVQRVNPDGTTTPVLTNLVFPTSLTVGPDGVLYVTNFGNEGNQGQGQVLRVVPGDDAARGPDVPGPAEEGTYASLRPTPTPLAGVVPVGTVEIVEPDDALQWGYSPAEITVNQGEALTFTNTGRIAHTGTAATGDFDTGSLLGGQSITIVFDTPGRHEYFCQPHPWMKGAVIVTGEGGAETGAAATFSGDDTPPNIGLLTAFLFVAALLIGVFAAGFALRRKPEPELVLATAQAAGGDADLDAPGAPIAGTAPSAAPAPSDDAGKADDTADASSA